LKEANKEAEFPVIAALILVSSVAFGVGLKVDFIILAVNLIDTEFMVDKPVAVFSS
jgi:hypothetical protein